MTHDRRRQTGHRQRKPVTVLNMMAGPLMPGLLILGLASAAHAQNPPSPARQDARPATVTVGAPWVWTLYADGEPVVLAQEIPDTPQLKTTLECEPRSGQVRLSLYDAADLGNGPVILRSGPHTATGEMQTVRLRLSTSLPADHPVFMAFVNNGEMKFSREEQVKTVSVGPQHLPLLRRFARACAG